MSKVIAIWGTPDSGKTTFAIKLANAIYEKYVTTVLIVFTDIETPSFPVICPLLKEGYLSIGAMLSKTEIRKEDVLSGVVTMKGRDNYGLAGFNGGDNRNRYPEYTVQKAEELLDRMKDIADVIIVDCMSPLHDILSDTAVKTADKVFRLAAPNLKSISFLASQLPLYIDKEYQTNKQVVVLNNPVRDIDVPIEEMKAQLGKVDYVVPFSRRLAEQYASGELTMTTKDKKVREMYTQIATKEVAD